MIKIAEPYIGKEEKKIVIKTLDSGKIIQGKNVEDFEKLFASFVGTKYAVAVSSGTAALHLGLLGLGIGDNDEVITTPFSFIASTSSIILSGAKPVFVDIDPITFNINPNEIEKKITKHTKAILPVHLYGLPANMKLIMKIAKKYNLKVIEDACQAHGAVIGDKKVGSFGDLGCFSFYPTKNMFVGEGGMVTTNSSKIAKKVKLLRSHGSQEQYRHSVIGFNYRMTDIAASIGLVQMKRIDANNRKRIKNALYLSKKLKQISQVITPSIPTGYRHVFHQYTVLVDKNKKLQVYLKEKGIESRIYYPIPIHLQKAVRDLCPEKNSLKISEKITGQILSLPIHPLLTKKNLDTIARSLIEYYKLRK